MNSPYRNGQTDPFAPGPSLQSLVPGPTGCGTAGAWGRGAGEEAALSLRLPLGEALEAELSPTEPCSFPQQAQTPVCEAPG